MSKRRRNSNFTTGSTTGGVGDCNWLVSNIVNAYVVEWFYFMRIIYNFSTPTEYQRVVTKEYTTMYTIAELDSAQAHTKEEWQEPAATDLSHTIVAKKRFHNRERFDTANAAFIDKMKAPLWND